MKPTIEDYKKFIEFFNHDELHKLEEMLHNGFIFTPILEVDDPDLRNNFAALFLKDKNIDILNLVHKQLLKEPKFIEEVIYKNGKFPELFRMYVKNNLLVLINDLFDLTNYKPYITRDVYKPIFQRTWNVKVKEDQGLWMQILDQVKEDLQNSIKFEEYKKIPLNTAEPFKKNIADVYFDLFKVEMQTPANKEEAILIAIAEFYNLLNYNPQFTLPYFRYINDEFARYYQEKTKEKYPVVSSSTYEIKPVHAYLYPCPNKTYTNHKHKRLLGEFLQLFFQRHGLKGKIYKFHGFVPTKTADDIVSKGNLFLDGQLGIGLFHGKYSHVFQDIALYFFLKDGLITSEYKGEKITPEEINAAIIKHNLWSRVRDTSRPRHVSFSDPYRIISVILSQGKDLGLGDLQNVLLENFCVGINKLLDMYNSQLKTPITMDHFWSYLNLYIISTFFHIPRALEIQRNKEELKKSNLFSQGNTHMVIESKYEPLTSFSSRPYSDKALENKKNPQMSEQSTSTSSTSFKKPIDKRKAEPNEVISPDKKLKTPKK